MSIEDFIPGGVKIETTITGPRAVMFGGTHGDEVSGVHAIERILSEFKSGSHILTRGSLVLVRSNEEAIKAGKRYLTYNLNRQFKDEYDAAIDQNAYEYKRAQELKSVLRQCDYFFDLHSAPIAQEPFLVCESSPAIFYKQVGLQKIITGWSKFSSGSIGGDAENYANTHGAKATTLEAGSHFDPVSIDVAYGAAISMLSLLNMVDPPKKLTSAAVEVFDMYHVQTKDYEDFKYLPGVRNFLPIPKDSPYAYQNNQPLSVGEDSYLLIPMKPEETKIGEEVCYLGRRVSL